MNLQALRVKFAEPIDAASLGLFRILWGVIITYEATENLARIPNIYTAEMFHFEYALFTWLGPWPEDWMMAVEAWVMIATGVLVTLGVAFRFSSALHTLLYAHFFLIEPLFYNNHFYLSVLLGMLLTVSRADACYSVTRWLAARKGLSPGPPTLPFWNLVALRGQMFIVYFYGGIAKLNGDWIRGEPVRLWMKHTETIPPLSWIIDEPWFAYFISFSGIVIDLSVGFLLLYRKTFWPAAAVLVGFHLTNSQLFPIGIFPWLGIASLLIFAPEDLPRRVASWMRRHFGGAATVLPELPSVAAAPASKLATGFVLIYLAVQALLPLRIHFYRENPSWSEVGHSFSWRMMLRYKDAHANFEFEPPNARILLDKWGKEPYLDPLHFRKMVKYPEFIVQWAHALDAALKEVGVPDAEIRAVVVASLNGRPYQLLVDPKRDLTEVELGIFERYDWIVPLRPDQPVGNYPGGAEQRREMIQRAVDEYNREQREIRERESVGG